MTPVETAQQIYAAFGRGDIPAILAHLAEDVEWEYGAFPNPVPWLQLRRGRAGATEFFQALAALDISHFEPLKILGDADTAVGICRFEATVRATGKRIVEAGEVHLFQVNAQGLVQRFRHAADTWQQAMALRAD